MTNNYDCTTMIETINRHLRKVGYKQLRLVLLLLYELEKHIPQREEAQA